MKIQFTATFRKLYKKADKKIQSSFQKRLKLFLINPNDLQLKNHRLKGTIQNLYSINITGDWRALYTEYQNNNETIVLFEVLGTHSQLYK